MIYTEMVEINGEQYQRTYSDAFMIERDGVRYEEAVDPPDSGRVYTETDVPRSFETGGDMRAENEDMRAALELLGVTVDG